MFFMNMRLIGEKYGLLAMAPAEQAAVLQDIWMNEAAGYREAGEVLRGGSLEPSARAEALELRLQHGEHCDALLDAHSEVVRAMGTAAIGPPDICA